MAKFNRYDNRWDRQGRQRSNEELDQMELEFNQQQQIKQKQIMTEFNEKQLEILQVAEQLFAEEGLWAV